MNLFSFTLFSFRNLIVLFFISHDFLLFIFRIIFAKSIFLPFFCQYSFIMFSFIIFSKSSNSSLLSCKALCSSL